MSEVYQKKSRFACHSYAFANASSQTNGGPVIQLPSTGAATFFTGDDSVTGSYNPAWRSEVRNGSDATTPCEGIRHSFEGGYLDTESIGFFQSVGPQTAAGSGYLYLGYPSYSAPASPNADSSLQTRVTNRCISKFLDACDSVRSSIEAGQDIGEFRETLESIHHPLRSMQDKLKHYLARLTKSTHGIRSIPSIAKVVSDTYLEFRFGINPLVADVAQVIADVGRYRFPSYPVHASAHEKYSGSDGIATLGNMQSYPVNTIHSIRYSEYRCRFKGTFRARTAADSGQLSWAQSLRLLPEDWIPTAWDLLPYSWMIDYFVNVGEIYRGLSFVFSDLVWACKTTHDTSTVKYDGFVPVKLNLPIGCHWVNKGERISSPGKATLSISKFSRSKLTAADLIPRVQFSVPTSKFPYLNMLAVGTQKFKALSNSWKAYRSSGH